MISVRKLSGSSFQKLFHRLGLKPIEGWAAILGFILVTMLLAITGAGSILNLAFPAGAFAVSIFLYLRSPVLYIGFTWWLLFLTPFVRRYADYRSSFTDPSPILLAPYLAILAIAPTLFKEVPNIYQQRSAGLFFILPCAAIFYGTCIGVVQNISLTQIAIASLDWLTPILFGFYLFINWRIYPSYRQNIERTFLWGVLVTGIYGIYQYMVAPEWDRFWRIKTDFITVGLPEPFQFNVFSTMNANGPFAIAMMAGLLLLLNSRSYLRFPAMGVGILAILLSNVRTSWGASILGILTYTSSLKLKTQIRFLITLLVIGIIAVPLVNMEYFNAKISDRVETFSNLEKDGSRQTRIHMYQTIGYRSLTTLVGSGIGSRNEDSGLITMLVQLGWIGTIPYITGMLFLTSSLFQSSKNVNDSFIHTTRSIVLPMFAILFMGSAMIELSGIIFWGFLGIGMASNKYYRHINKLKGSQIR